MGLEIFLTHKPSIYNYSLHQQASRPNELPTDLRVEVLIASLNPDCIRATAMYAVSAIFSLLSLLNALCGSAPTCKDYIN